MRDDRRLKYLKDKGYEILIVWAYDFSTKKSDIINDCKNFLNNGEK
jgi:G:T-mismatch repair DNA endonuclease (very short patch repair protein)